MGQNQSKINDSHSSLAPDDTAYRTMSLPDISLKRLLDRRVSVHLPTSKIAILDVHGNGHSMHSSGWQTSFSKSVHHLRQNLQAPSLYASAKSTLLLSCKSHIFSDTKRKHWIKSGISKDRGKPTSKGTLGVLPVEICVQILKFLDIPSLVRISSSSSYWNQLSKEETIYQKLAIERFGLHASRAPLLLSNEYHTQHRWKEIYIQLDAGLTTWSGYAIDPVTNSNRPYSMELIIKRSRTSFVRGLPGNKTSKSIGKNLFYRVSKFDGCCRWSQLDDALTRMDGFIVDHLQTPSSRFAQDAFLKTLIPRRINFEELEIIRGQDLAIPNRYHGLLFGNTLLGIYDPGHPDLIGSFALVMEDSIPLSSHNTFQFKVGDSWKGILIISKDSGENHDTAVYVQLEMTRTHNDSLEGVLSLYPSHECRSSCLPESEIRLGKPLKLRLKMAVVSNGPMQARLSLLGPDMPGMHADWMESYLPIANEIHLFMQGDALIGLYSFPRPGSLFLKRS